MSQPCEQKDVILEIRRGQASMESAIERQETSNREVVSELRDVVKELREVLMDGRESRIKLDIHDRNIETLFGLARSNSEDLKQAIENLNRTITPLAAWQSKMDGSIRVIVGIPALLSTISLIISITIALK